MKRNRLEIFGIVFIVLFTFFVLFTFITLPHDSSADTLTVYGPESFIRNKGKPVIVTHTFTVLTSGNACTMKIYNGGMEDSEFERVSSAVISLNGVQVVEPNEFNQNVELIEKPITLSTSNEISVEVRGKPGGGLTIEIDCSSIMVTVPNLFGLSLFDAEAAISGANLITGSIFEEYSFTTPTGVVLRQNPLPETEVEPGTDVDLLLTRQPPAGSDEIIPASWAGLWEVTINYMDMTSNNLVAVEEISGAICTGDPIGLVLLETMLDSSPHVNQAGCTGSASESSINLSCSTEVNVEGCVVDGTLLFQINITDDSLTGTGTWSVTNDCSLQLPGEGQTFIISGLRIASDPGAECSASVSSFFQKFMKHPLLPVVEGLL